MQNSKWYSAIKQFNGFSGIQLLLIAFVLANFTSSKGMAQTVAPSIINTAGKSSKVGYYNFDWSLGESAAIHTLAQGNMMLTNGFLQYNIANQPLQNSNLSWQIGDIITFPNPVKDVVEIDILHGNKGRINIQLQDVNAQVLKEKSIDYNGIGAIEKWQMGNLPAGQYLLSIQQLSPVTGGIIKNGGFKIIKNQ